MRRSFRTFFTSHPWLLALPFALTAACDDANVGGLGENTDDPAGTSSGGSGVVDGTSSSGGSSSSGSSSGAITESWQRQLFSSLGCDGELARPVALPLGERIEQLRAIRAIENGYVAYGAAPNGDSVALLLDEQLVPRSASTVLFQGENGSTFAIEPTEHGVVIAEAAGDMEGGSLLTLTEIDGDGALLAQAVKPQRASGDSISALAASPTHLLLNLSSGAFLPKRLDSTALLPVYTEETQLPWVDRELCGSREFALAEWQNDHFDLFCFADRADRPWQHAALGLDGLFTLTPVTRPVQPAGLCDQWSLARGRDTPLQFGWQSPAKVVDGVHYCESTELTLFVSELDAAGTGFGARRTLVTIDPGHSYMPGGAPPLVLDRSGYAYAYHRDATGISSTIQIGRVDAQGQARGAEIYLPGSNASTRGLALYAIRNGYALVQSTGTGEQSWTLRCE